MFKAFCMLLLSTIYLSIQPKSAQAVNASKSPIAGREFSGILRAFAYAPQGKEFATLTAPEFGSKTDLLRIWDLSTWRVLRYIKITAAENYTIGFQADGTVIFVGSGLVNNRTNHRLIIRRWNQSLRKDYVVSVKPDSLIGDTSSLQLSADGKSLLRGWFQERVIASQKHSILREGFQNINAITAEVQSTVAVSTSHPKTPDAYNYISSWQWFPDRQSILRTSGVLIQVCNPKNGNVLRQWRVATSILTNAIVTTDGKYIVSASDKDNSIRVWQVSSGKLHKILVGHQAETERMWVMTTRGCYPVDTVYKGVMNIAADTTNGEIISSHGVDGTIRLWNVDKGALLYTFHLSPITTLDMSAWRNNLRFSPDGKTLSYAYSSVFFINIPVQAQFPSTHINIPQVKG